MTIKWFLIMNMRSTRHTHRIHTHRKPHVYDQSNRICAFTRSHMRSLSLCLPFSRIASVSFFYFFLFFFILYVCAEKSGESGMTRKGWQIRQNSS